MIGTEKLVFDTSVALDENSNVGAFLRSAAGTLITHTTDGAKERLDVDIKLASGNAASFGIFAEDSVHASGDLGQHVLGVRSDAEAALAADGDYHPFLFNSVGRLKVDAEVSVATGSDKAEDAAHASGDIGTYTLSVRQDVLASSTSADGDYQSFKTDSVGSLWTRLSQPIEVSVPNTAVATSAVSVNDTVGGVAIPTSNLTARKRVLIQNLGNKAIWIGASGVTIASGVRIAAGGNWETEAGPAIAFYGIANTGVTADVRILELS